MLVELKSGLHSLRNLRGALLKLAYDLAQEPNKKGLLVLADSRITATALERERDLARRTLRPGVLNRISIAVEREGKLRGLAQAPDPGFRDWLDHLIARHRKRTPTRWRQPPEAAFLVLLNEWFQRHEAATTRWLMGALGCSYPTVARALERLNPVLQRGTDRRVKLAGFPAEQWQKVVANLDRAYPTIRYVDRTGQRRSPEVLLKRAAGLDNPHLGVGGVIAARHYFPEFDLRGTPRLDLTLHCPEDTADLSFVEQIDAALERTHDNDESATLAIHMLRRWHPLFDNDAETLPYADRVSTLLDLHEARLQTQAQELLSHLVESVG